MSPALKKEVAELTSLKWVEFVPAFAGVSQDCLLDLASHLRVMTFVPKEIIIKVRLRVRAMCLIINNEGCV